MHVKDKIALNVAQYPSLFLTTNFEDSKLLVLEHIFIVLGNGYEWANTKKPQNGGYLTEPKHHKRHGDWVRSIDPDYGKVGFDYNIDRYFTEPVYEIHPDLMPEEIKNKEGIEGIVARTSFQLKNINSKERYDVVDRMYKHKLPWAVFSSNRYLHVCGEQEKDATIEHYAELGIKTYAELQEKKDLTNYIKHPYPNFNKTYSCFWEPECQYIQDDWQQAGIEHMEHWLKYFQSGKWQQEKFLATRYGTTMDLAIERERPHIPKHIAFIEETITKLKAG